MKKSFYYDFLPSKAEESVLIARGQLHEVTRTLIEIRDYYDPPPPRFDLKHPWTIKKTITEDIVSHGKLLLSQNDVFDHIFRYWTMDLCNYVIYGNKLGVIIADYSDEENPKKFQSENIFFQGNYSSYILGCTDVVRSRLLQPGDEIGLFWDVVSATFGFKVLSRGNPTKE